MFIPLIIIVYVKILQNQTNKPKKKREMKRSIVTWFLLICFMCFVVCVFFVSSYDREDEDFLTETNDDLDLNDDGKQKISPQNDEGDEHATSTTTTTFTVEQSDAEAMQELDDLLENSAKMEEMFRQHSPSKLNQAKETTDERVPSSISPPPPDAPTWVVPASSPQHSTPPSSQPQRQPQPPPNVDTDGELKAQDEQQEVKSEALLTRAQLNRKYVPLRRRRRLPKANEQRRPSQTNKSSCCSGNYSSENEIYDATNGEGLLLLWYAPVLSFSGYGSEALEFISGIWRSVLAPFETDTSDGKPDQNLLRDRFKSAAENMTFPPFFLDESDEGRDVFIPDKDDDGDEKSDHHDPQVVTGTIQQSSSTRRDEPTTRTSSPSFGNKTFTHVASFGCFHHGDAQQLKFPSYHTAEFLACSNGARGRALTSPTAVEPNWNLLQPHPSRIVVVCHSNQGMWSLPKPDFSTVTCPPAVHPVLARVGRTMFETDRVPLEWFRRLDQMDELWVPTEFHRNSFLKSYEEWCWLERNGSTESALDLISIFESKLRVIPEPIDTEWWRRPDQEYSSEYLAILVEDRVAQDTEKEKREKNVQELDPSDVEFIEETVASQVEGSFRIPVAKRNTRNRLHALTVLSGLDVSPDYTIDDPILGPGPSIFRVPGEHARDKNDDEDCDDRILNLHRQYEQPSEVAPSGEKRKHGKPLRELVLSGDLFELSAFRLGDRSSWSKKDANDEDVSAMLKRSRRRNRNKRRNKNKNTNNNDEAHQHQRLLESRDSSKMIAVDDDDFTFVPSASGELATTDGDRSDKQVRLRSDAEDGDEGDDEGDVDDPTVHRRHGGSRCVHSRIFLSTFKRERRKGWDILVRAFVEQFSSRSKRIKNDDKTQKIVEQVENRNVDAPCLILHTNDFAEDLPIDFAGTVDLFLEFLYAEFPRSLLAENSATNETVQRFDYVETIDEAAFVGQQDRLQKKEKDEAIASMSQVWPTHFASQDEFIRFMATMQQQQQQQQKPAVVDRVTAARLALHQRKELLIDLKANPQHYHDLCQARCLRSNKNRLHTTDAEDEEDVATCTLCDKLRPDSENAQTGASTSSASWEEKARIWRRLMRERLQSHDSPIVLFTAQPLSFEEYRNLIMSADVSVLTTRGEGWGRPVQEAMSLAVPSIVTNWSGPASFSRKEFSFLIPIRAPRQLRVVPDDLWFSGHLWAEPSVAEVRNLLVKAETMELREIKKMGMLAREFVVANLDSSVIGEEVIKATKELANTKVRKFT